ARRPRDRPRCAPPARPRWRAAALRRARRAVARGAAGVHAARDRRPLARRHRGAGRLVGDGDQAAGVAGAQADRGGGRRRSGAERVPRAGRPGHPVRRPGGAVRLAGRIPVEPLDEERLTNIERRVVAGAVDTAVRGDVRARPGLTRVLAVAAVVAAGAIGWALHVAPDRPPVIAEPVPVRVQTSPARSMLDIGDARIESDPDTAFTVT